MDVSSGTLDGGHRAALDGLPLEEAAEHLPELRAALDTWGTDTPR